MDEQLKNQKYHDLVQTARNLFWKHGFRRVSIEEICKKAGVSKMTYYRFFPNKIELAKTVFDGVVEEGRQKFKELMASDIPASEKIRGMILMKEESTHDISKEFLEDFYLGTQPELKAYVEEITRKVWDEMLYDFKKAQQEGVFRSDFKPEFLIHVSFKIVDMMKDENLLKLYGSPQELIMEYANFVSYGISNREGK
ncbi:TetR/AcrR family transcriptional regulator [Gaoshiqia sp. Z1-71]|uniref:TetR/AcrR family transcriptional regulator n=1 Tax=Gaoshiqia hydrogeniformans TaxID=3290090 RepID=UPI003BF7DE19